MHVRLPPGPPLRKGVVQTARYFAGFALDPIGFVKGRFDQYGDIYYAPNPKGGLFVLKHPDHIREVLSTRASVFGKGHSAFAQLERVLGKDGLLIAEGETWTRQRRMVQPAFSATRMAGYGAIMVEEARRTADAWKVFALDKRRPAIDVDREMMALTLRIVSRTLFGHGVTDDDIATVARAMHAFQRSLSTPDFLPAWMPLPQRRRLAQGLADLDRIVYRVIRERRSRAEAGAEKRDLLQLLVDAVDVEGKGDRLTENEVRDQLVTLFLAGHETTSQALTWALYALSNEPNAEARLHAEVDLLKGKPPEVGDLEHLPWTEQVILETMRLYPPVYAIARQAKEECEVGGFTVPRGSEVMVWVYMTHHDPRFFPNPGAFQPERFDKERVAAIPKFAYFPFGAGPRACIGKTFALMEARLILATLAQRFRVRVASNQRVALAPRITLTPKHGMKMHVAPR
jgi:cytochrome P450